tara:strand:+ start:3458 stop:3799 length:342 start_codon:yes stop_codon:yes gene_type:complete
MAAVYVNNLVVNTGSTFQQTFNLESTDNNSALNLSGYTVNSQMRKWAGASSATDFVASIPTPLEGKILLELTSTTTTGLKAGRYVYDIIITKGGVTERVVEGNVLVREGVTRS